jgi:putative tryptophan/tyrosine transport system substrate-binding protein
MRRREFLASGAAVLSLTLSAAAEPSKPWRVVLVSSGGAGVLVPVFQEALHQLGYEVGRNLLLEVREAKGNYSILPDIMKEVVSLKPDVIVVEATPAIAAAKKATSTIPIVMAPATDPIGSGFIQSFAHPGGNITGLANLFGDQTTKTLDFLHAVLPQAKKIGVLISSNPTHPALFEVAKVGASTIGISAERFVAETPDDLEATFEAIKSANCEAVYVLADPPRRAVPILASKFGLPVIYQNDYYVEKLGGLMSYGTDALSFVRSAASYVDRILKGDKPADMPVQQPTTFRFVVNLRAAKTLGLAIPESVLAQADEVIE